MRLSIINFAGIARTDVAVGTVSDASMLWTTRADTPRIGSSFDALGVTKVGIGFAMGSAGVAGVAATFRTTCCDGAGAAGACTGAACATGVATGAGAAGATGAGVPGIEIFGGVTGFGVGGVPAPGAPLFGVAVAGVCVAIPACGLF